MFVRLATPGSDRTEAVAAVAKLREQLRLFGELDPRSTTYVRRVLVPLDQLSAALEVSDEEYTRRQIAGETLAQGRTPNTRRYNLLNLIDELSAKATAFGNPLDGGMEERKVLFQMISALRQACLNDIAADLDDPQALLQLASEIRAEIQRQATLRSVVTGAAFNFLPLEANLAQCDKILMALDESPTPPRREVVPVVSPRQIKSLLPIAPSASWGWS